MILNQPLWGGKINFVERQMDIKKEAGNLLFKARANSQTTDLHLSWDSMNRESRHLYF